MKINDIIKESYVPRSLRKEMEQKGYTYIARGRDQQVYLSPNGNTITKIFGTTKFQGKTDITWEQKAFITFADYCSKHPDNPFLPKFSDWHQFSYEGYTFLQIETERLFKFSGLTKEWGYFLTRLTNYARVSNSIEDKEKFIDEQLKGESAGPAPELFTHMSKESFYQLWDTIYDLANIAKSHGYHLDLHSDNFMLSSTGHTVINDPFYVYGINV